MCPWRAWGGLSGTGCGNGDILLSTVRVHFLVIFAIALATARHDRQQPILRRFVLKMSAMQPFLPDWQW
jgi:hypothetical protein